MSSVLGSYGYNALRATQELFLKMSKDVFIFGSPRGGTSLVASVFFNHGFWLGTEYVKQPVHGPRIKLGSKGYRCYENAGIKSYLKKNHPLQVLTAMDCSDKEAHRLRVYCQLFRDKERSKEDLHSGVFFKTTVEYYPIFKRAYPNAVFVFIKRHFESAVEGLVKRKGEAVRQDMFDHVVWRYQYIDELIKNNEGYLVDADRVAAGDLYQFPSIFAAAGVPFDPEKARKSIDPSIWHRV